MTGSIGVVAIGRNEGERLRACLDSLTPLGHPILYVDSGSDDGSPEVASALGAEVHRLDPARPFSASRARREGAERLLEGHPETEWIFFVDADCVVAPGWLDDAIDALSSDPAVGAVCGRRREREPDRSAYNLLCDYEWDTPVGPCDSVGGDAVFQVEAYQQAGGFDPTVPAGEEPELCQRVRRAGWKLQRIDAEMTVHDAALTAFTPWWRRQIRTGYSGADVEARFGLGLFDRLIRGATIWAFVLPLMVAAAVAIAWRLGTPAAAITAVVLATALVAAQTVRIASRIANRPWNERLKIATLTMLAKPAIAWGAVRYQIDRAIGRGARLVEYKRSQGADVSRLPT